MDSLSMKKDPLYYEKIGENFDKFMSEYDVYQRTHLILNKLLLSEKGNKNISMLEIGCGTGKISQELNHLTDHLTVSDISEKLCKDVAQKIGCKYLVGDCANLPIADESFDIIVSSECIEHTPNPYASLLEMKRVLRKGGRLVITTPNKIWYPVLILSQILKLRKYEGTENWTWPFKTKAWLVSNGFADIYFSGCHLFPWQIPLAKKVLPFVDKFGNSLYPVMINYGFSTIKS